MVDSEYHFPKFGVYPGYNLGSGKYYFYVI